MHASAYAIAWHATQQQTLTDLQLFSSANIKGCSGYLTSNNHFARNAAGSRHGSCLPPHESCSTSTGYSIAAGFKYVLSDLYEVFISVTNILFCAESRAEVVCMSNVTVGEFTLSYKVSTLCL